MSEIPFEYYGGIEGGASNTKFALVRSDGKILSKSDGGGTNQFLIGMDECLKRIESLVKEGLKNAGLPMDTKLEGLGLSLSGGDSKSVQEEIIDIVKKNYSTLTHHTYVGSDTMSALATALPQGGVVLIAGTGSNCQLINTDGTTANCGGWGHKIGDESSACWISFRAIKILYNHEDRFVICKQDVNVVKSIIFKYFQMENLHGILSHLYSTFDKAKFSRLCKELATAGLEQGDPLCCEIFKEAGFLLGQHICAISSKVNQDLKMRDGGLPIVCVGSVFKSWKLLEPGFVECMSSRAAETGIREVTLFSLTNDASVGAAALGAKAAGKILPLDYSSNANIFFTAKF
ncbi:N-acetyl-d-glucosamine kinase [Plakobranchus ocellatus]|uniref:N-acetyl-D-glucosamine kinase n=1 Tax=Plakobranchus ocellatus TaxID=259542 RepID=A0AAV3Y6K3_9GAST|nr:N-acetyl-d-glucosamine kinase [Plakobranchus ocellatus]